MQRVLSLATGVTRDKGGRPKVCPHDRATEPHHFRIREKPDGYKWWDCLACKRRREIKRQRSLAGSTS